MEKDKYYIHKPFAVPKYRIVFEGANSLSDVGDQYIWFSPAAIYRYGMFTDVNLSDLIQNLDFKVFYYQFDKPIFTRFGGEWDHLLWAMESEKWVKFCDKLLETVQIDIPNKLVYQYAMQELELWDPLFSDKNSGILDSRSPKCSVNVFVVLSNTGQLAFDTKNTLFSRPGLLKYTPSDIHVKAAKKLFSSKKELTQDNAFARYRRIMLAAQDAEYKAEVEKKGVRDPNG
jgi:hypothetical protein